MNNLAMSYLKNYKTCLKQIEEGNLSDELRLKTFYFMAKYIVTNNNGKDNLYTETDLYITMSDEDLLNGVSTAKFVNYFPIDKTYDGEKYRTKDYFSTIEAVKEQGKTLKNVFEFFWDYQNPLIKFYLVHKMCLMSNHYRNYTGKGLMETWADDNGIRIYTLHKDSKGKEYLFDKKTSKTIKVKKSKPKHLKIVR